MGHASGMATARTNYGADSDVPADLFPDMPDAKKRKFILVEDNVRGSRLRIRVTLEGVNTKEIPDSFRKGSSVFPRSFFPREMQSPPPSATGGTFFENDDSDDGNEETEGREISRGRGRTRAGRGRGKTTVKVPMGEGRESELTVPRTRKSIRGKEVRLNELGCRMAWLQSRVFAGRTLFLQRASEYPPSLGGGYCRSSLTYTCEQWTATATRRARPSSRPCRTSRRWRRTTRRGPASGGGTSG